MPVAAAVIGAVEDALRAHGVRIAEFPLTPMRLLALIDQGAVQSLEIADGVHESVSCALPLEDAWVLMLDVPRILPCLPGARLTGDSGDGKYSGSVTLRLGPIKLAFDGQAELLRQDDAAHIAWLRGSGRSQGRGAVSSEFSFALEPAAGGTAVAVTTGWNCPARWRSMAGAAA